MDHGSVIEKEVCVDIESVDDDLGVDQEKRKKSLSAKKPPRPPQAHRAYSLDAVDQKLIKELAMIKRARIERMKTLMHKRSSKNPSSSSSSSSSNGSLFAMLFTIIFFIVILFQGMSCQISCQGSPQTNVDSGLIFIQLEESNPSGYDSV